MTSRLHIMDGSLPVVSAQSLIRPAADVAAHSVATVNSGFGWQAHDPVDRMAGVLKLAPATTPHHLATSIDHTPFIARSSENPIIRPRLTPVYAHQTEPYVKSLFRSPIFQTALQQSGRVVANIIARLKDHPLVAYSPTGDKIERLHFTSYLGVLNDRTGEYDSDLISDLYLVHELVHQSILYYNPFDTFESWKQKMYLNEKIASVISEALIYFDMPELRDLVPWPTIWVDRFLKDDIPLNPGETNQAFFNRDPHAFFSQLLNHFVNIDQKPKDSLDDIEKRTRDYSATNNLWLEVWKDAAPIVEAHMQEYQILAKHDPARALEFHLRWLEASTQSGNLPFPDQAREYYEELDSFYRTRSEANPQINPRSKISPLISDEEQIWQLLDLAAKDLAHRDGLGHATKTELLPASIRSIGEAGISATVYAFPTPEAQMITEKFWQEAGPNKVYPSLFSAPYTRRQDPSHHVFLNGWENWSSPIVTGLDQYPHRYVGNGSSEIIRAAFGFLIKSLSPGARLHVFEGEYEGARAFANSFHIDFVTHPRTPGGLADFAQKANQGDFFYISQPSAIDGNVWAGYDLLVQIAEQKGIKLLVDLCYVGVVPDEFHVNVSSSAIRAVFFSLSKSFGVYYQRIGGGFFREPNEAVFGNLWFKGLQPLEIGTRLMASHGVYDIPRRYQPAQMAVIDRVNEKLGHLGVSLAPSDVYLLGHQPRFQSTDPEHWITQLVRQETLRACLTPMMETMIVPDNVKIALGLM